MKIAIGQVNTTIGDFVANLNKMISFTERAEKRGADLIVFPEQVTTGYPPRDLLESPRFIDRNLEILESLATRTRDISIICGFVGRNEKEEGKPLFNGAAFLHKGKIAAIQKKRLLPEYDIFDEARYFEPGDKTGIIEFNGMRLGMLICEDVWRNVPIGGRKLYQCDPVGDLKEKGCDLVIHINASPYWQGKVQKRREILKNLAQDLEAYVVHCNMVGGNDELIFDGASSVIGPDGQFLLRATRFREDVRVVELKKGKRNLAKQIEGEDEEVIAAIELGILDYFTKCRFRKAVIGLSGGLDSAVAGFLATRALGRENMLGVIMPSRYTSLESMEDAKGLADHLGIETIVLPIDHLYSEFLNILKEPFEEMEPDLTEENIQARIRGNLLMALSNKFKALMINTGNKSELAVGYCTLYGDLAGGLAVISDLPKTQVFRLARYINREEEIIPERIITKPPSAELRDNQKDEDSLPPYEMLDAILKAYIEEGQDLGQIVQQGFPTDVVREVLEKVDHSEFKRRQAPIGLKVTHKAFGTGRRIPIAQRWR
jgi:NAD+ synthase (glutamine-hydrolysing)